MTEVVRSRPELDKALSARPGRAALVPTMGALHDGHVRLVEYARARADVVVASIFVNPTQFGPGEDLDRYPRTFDADVARCERAGVDLVFAPEVDEVYPEGSGAGGVHIDPGPLGRLYEGEVRPTHFAGVLLVVAKLLGLVRPDIAVFGEKDYQQLTLVRAMVTALCMPVEVIGAPTVRERDGLAMSSRNAFLSAEDRTCATVLHRALAAGADAAAGGADVVLAAARAELERVPAVQPDYLVLTDEEMGSPLPGRPARLLVAARVGSTRLLDNIGLDLGTT